MVVTATLTGAALTSLTVAADDFQSDHQPSNDTSTAQLRVVESLDDFYLLLLLSRSGM